MKVIKPSRTILLIVSGALILLTVNFSIVPVLQWIMTSPDPELSVDFIDNPNIYKDYLISGDLPLIGIGTKESKYLAGRDSAYQVKFENGSFQDGSTTVSIDEINEYITIRLREKNQYHVVVNFRSDENLGSLTRIIGIFRKLPPHTHVFLHCRKY